MSRGWRSLCTKFHLNQLSHLGEIVSRADFWTWHRKVFAFAQTNNFKHISQISDDWITQEINRSDAGNDPNGILAKVSPLGSIIMRSMFGSIRLKSWMIDGWTSLFVIRDHASINSMVTEKIIRLHCLNQIKSVFVSHLFRLSYPIRWDSGTKLQRENLLLVRLIDGRKRLLFINILKVQK